MESPQDPLLVYVVISCWHEASYITEPGSMPRISLGYTAHTEELEAVARAEAEAEFCLLPSQTASKRRCALLRVEVVTKLLDVNGDALSWISDRLNELARRAGLLIPSNPALLITTAFKAMEEGHAHTLPMLQAAGAAQTLGISALPILLRTMAGMPAASALTLKGSVEALLTLPPCETQNLIPVA